ncbi:GntR family transcriptional regulator [Achromobacter sp. GG226]|uniref:GntR family transcriptional regulator n=1 Tax=Verticiella alkaliphila TaxID=2779529 RepID=UPI001C0BB63B|nr:GntR family transcriptional regulator [Verticiella sp. GG226]MBU4612746.1 GntR family transcriptional regulator [Verticiella sp. GG226]
MAALPQGALKVDRSGKTLRELSLEKMREAIWAGHFRPGERLVERSLCEQLDVSRSIVREVLRHLEAEGLVESVPHQGPVVARLSADQAAQIYEIRALLEGQAARACAERADSPAIEALAALNDATQAAFAEADHQAVMLRTAAFYERLFLEAGMTVAWDVVQSLNARITRLRAMTIGSSGRRDDAAAEMARIVQALRARDGAAAQAASEDHVRRVARIAAERLAAAAT